MGKVDDLKTIEGTRAEKLKAVAEIATDRNVYGWMTPDALVHRRIIDTRTNTFSHIPIVLEERVSQNELKHWMIVPMEIIDNTHGYAYSKTTSNVG